MYEMKFEFSDPKLRVLNFSGSEAISQLYQYTIDLVATGDVGDTSDRTFSYDDYVDTQRVLTIQFIDAKQVVHTRYVTGIITRFEVAAVMARHTVYRAWLAPPQARMNLRRRLKIWQDRSVADIVKEVVGEWGIKQEWKASGVGGPRDYCVQYRETDWEFCSRLLEEEGIAYYFKHDKSDVTTVFVDTDAYPSIDGKKNIAYNPKAERMTSAEEYIPDFGFGKQMRSDKVHLRDYNFILPKGERGVINGNAGVGKYEIYDYPGEYHEKKLADALAGIRLGEQQCLVKQGSGSSNCVRLVAGHRFILGDDENVHPRKDLNKEYLILELSMHGYRPGVLEEDGSAGDSSFGNHYQVLPAPIVYRPPRITPRPVMPSNMRARVTGPPGEEIYVDDKGRVRVWFFWDREKEKEGQKVAPLAEDDKNRCWIRVAHGWAGVGFGQWFIPRVGQEVLVTFIDGDPDRPVVTGRLYNDPEQRVPVSLLGEKDHSIIKTKSYPSDLSGKGPPDHWNELRLVDTLNKEKVHLRAQKDLDILVHDHDWTAYVKHDRKETVDNDQKVAVTHYSEHKAETIRIEASQKITIVCGASTIELTPASITIKSPQISSTASGPHTIQGLPVKIN